MNNSPSILVVDGLSETTEVLRAVFEPRGHLVNRVRQSQLRDSESLQPRVVVWHATESDEEAAANRLSASPRIVIGRTTSVRTSCEARRFSHPFEYGELLGAIEALLAVEAS